METSYQGHNQPCYYCGRLCDATAGNPSSWPIPLTHRDEPGRAKWHHIGCVSERLIENGGHEAAKRLALELTAAHNFIIEHGLYEEWAAGKEQDMRDLDRPRGQPNKA